MPAHDLDLLIDAARAAGEIAMSYWQDDPDVWEKPDGAGPVTEADLAVDTDLRKGLLRARPDYGWLSEETEDSDARLSNQRVFIVDPIDGTRAFIAGENHWAHSLAVVDNGQVTAAVVYLPVLKRLFSASAGGGAFLNGEPITAAQNPTADGAAVLGAKTNFDPVHWPGGIPAMNRHFRPSLAYRLALVAQGRFDAMITFRDTWEWDVAAGALLVEEAGAVVRDRLGHRVAFNNPHPALPGMLAGSAGLVGDMSARLRTP